MTATAPRYTTVRNAFSGERGTYHARVDADGTVRVWDSVAGYFTTCHSLTAGQIASARRRSGWGALATATANVERAKAKVARLRNWTTSLQADRYAAAYRSLMAAEAKLASLQPTA